MSDVDVEDPAAEQDDMFLSVRETVLQTCRTLADRGFLAGTGGNIAMRADDQHFCVTPSGTDYYTMVATDICVVRLEDGQQVAGERKPSVESGLHALVLKARPDCQASVHTHQPIASAYTLLARPLQVSRSDHQQLLGRTIPCAGYAPSGTSWLAGKVAGCVRSDVHAFLMRNHGVVCVGATVEQAMERVAALEQACAVYFEQQLGQRRSQLSPGLADAVQSKLSAAQAVTGSDHEH